ncbi:MAG: oleate hydratase [Tissierellia bacterium]|nr:oleate hydratase [Tissierellia bacterium]
MKKKNNLTGLAIAAATIGLSYLVTKSGKKPKLPQHLKVNRDESSNVYLLGSGIGNMAIALSLIYHANVLPQNIKIFQSSLNPWEMEYHLWSEEFQTTWTDNLWSLFEQVPYDGGSLKDYIWKHFSDDEPTYFFLSSSAKFQEAKDFSLDQQSKTQLLKIILGKPDILKDQTIGSVFAATNFLRSSYYSYLSHKYHLKNSLSSLLLQRALFREMEEDQDLGCTTTVIPSIHLSILQPIKDHLKELGVKFLDGYSPVRWDIKDDIVKSISFETDQIIEDWPMKAEDIIVQELPFHQRPLYGNLQTKATAFEKEPMENPIFDRDPLLPTDRQGSKIVFSMTFHSNEFYSRLKKRYPQLCPNSTLILTDGKGGISLTFPPIDSSPSQELVYGEILEPNAHGLFTNVAFTKCRGEEIFYELTRYLFFDEEYGDIRKGLKSFEFYLHPDVGILSSDIGQWANYRFFSYQEVDEISEYSMEKFVTCAIKIAHEFMGITHLDLSPGPSFSTFDTIRFMNKNF